MDQYIKETIARYRETHRRYKEVTQKLNELRSEASGLDRRLDAYERILKDSIGEEAFSEIEKEFTQTPTISASATGGGDQSITEIILNIIGNSGSEGMTAAQVFSAAQPFGIGIEKRNTVYGTLSRLTTSNRIKRIGKRYFTA